MFINSLKKKRFPYKRLITFLFITGLVGPNVARAMDNPSNQKKPKKKDTYIEGCQIEQRVKIEGDIDNEKWILVSKDTDSENLLERVTENCVTQNTRDKKLAVFTKEDVERIERRNKPSQSVWAKVSSWSNGEDY